MSPDLMITPIALILAVVAGIAIYLRARESKAIAGLGAFILGFAVLCISWLVPTILLTIRVDPLTVFFTDNWNVVEVVYLNNTSRWRWDPVLKYRPLRFAARRVSVSSHLQPITENPKVIKLSYVVELEILGSVKDTEVFYQNAYSKPNWSRETDWLQSRLNVFNYYCSKQLAQFHDPLDAKQQEAFSQLVQSFINDDVQKARATIVSIKFDLE